MPLWQELQDASGSEDAHPDAARRRGPDQVFGPCVRPRLRPGPPPGGASATPCTPAGCLAHAAAAPAQSLGDTPQRGVFLLFGQCRRLSSRVAVPPRNGAPAAVVICSRSKMSYPIVYGRSPIVSAWARRLRLRTLPNQCQALHFEVNVDRCMRHGVAGIVIGSAPRVIVGL